MILSKKKLETILFNWDIKSINTFRKIEKGVNHNWIIQTDSNKYILRNFCFKKPKDIKFELKYLDYLRRNKFSYEIPSPILANRGRHYVTYNDSHYYLYKFITGSDVSTFGRNELKQVAKMMAEYHRIIECSNLDNKHKFCAYVKEPILRELKSFNNLISEKSELKKEDEIFLKESGNLIPLLKTLSINEYSKLKKYPIHRDLNPENILWSKNKLVGVIDFDNVSSSKEPLIKDIGVMVQYSCRDRNQEQKLNLNLAKYFLKEYRKYHVLSDEEISLIPNINTAGFIEDFSFVYWQFLHDRPRARLHRFKLYSNSAQWYFENADKIVTGITP